MQFKLPKNSEQFVWTNHSIDKMRQYGLSEQRVRSVLHTPKRKEEGIAPNTVAVMQSTGTKKNPTEVWVMYQEINPKSETRNPKESFNSQFSIPKKRRIISTWRYPGISPIRTVPEIPDEVWAILDGNDDINDGK
jgi:hypothetical protein